jgi:hypothetical protein
MASIALDTANHQRQACGPAIVAEPSGSGIFLSGLMICGLAPASEYRGRLLCASPTVQAPEVPNHKTEEKQPGGIHETRVC